MNKEIYFVVAALKLYPGEGRGDKVKSRLPHTTLSAYQHPDSYRDTSAHPIDAFSPFIDVTAPQF